MTEEQKTAFLQLLEKLVAEALAKEGKDVQVQCVRC